MNIPWNDVIRGAAALTGNPATAALFKLLGLAVQAVGVDMTKANAVVDAVQKTVGELVDAVQGQGIMPDIRLTEPRHDAALALTLSGQHVPQKVADQAPGLVPPEVVA